MRGTRPCPDEGLKREIEIFLKLPDRERAENVSGLVASLSPFCVGKTAALFNDEEPMIDLNDALERGLICYFQLPTLYAPFLGRVTGKLVLQCFQAAVARRHLGLAKSKKFFGCILDDFQDYIYEGFTALLNKSRSANVGVVFSHQSKADLEKVGPEFADGVDVNTTNKVIMKNDHAETCESMAGRYGTTTSEKSTDRQTKGFFGKSRTGEGSVREVEEFLVHPNIMKRLARGQGIVSISHPKGTSIKKINFFMRKDLKRVPLTAVKKRPYDIAKAFLAPEAEQQANYSITD